VSEYLKKIVATRTQEQLDEVAGLKPEDTLQLLDVTKEIAD